MEFVKILNMIRRFLWLCVLTSLVASVTTYFVFNRQPTQFEAKTQLLVGPGLEDPNPDWDSLRIGGQLVQTYDELANTRIFLETINSKLNPKINPELLGQMIETRQNTDSRILTIIVRHQNPKQAIEIANVAAQTLVEMSPSKDNTTALLRERMSNQAHQLEQIVTNSESSIKQLESQLSALENTDSQNQEDTQTNLSQKNLIITQLGDERSRMSDALRTLATVYQVLLETNTNQLEIIEHAEESFPISNNIPLRVAGSGAAGIILTFSIIFVYIYFDDTIRSPEDFKGVTEVQVLSTIHKHNLSGGSGLEQIATFAQPNSHSANDYHTAVAKLLFSVGTPPPFTLLLCSMGTQIRDFTVEVEANLAFAFAQTGNRVVLVDAQFHNPALTKLFSAEGKPGFTDLMTKNSQKPKLTTVNDATNFQLLPSGLFPEKDSTRGINSAKITKLLNDLQKEADIILVAGPPISLFAESLTLASLVNGVILIAQNGKVHNKEVNDAVENLRDMNAHLTGVIFDNN